MLLGHKEGKNKDKMESLRSLLLWEREPESASLSPPWYSLQISHFPSILKCKHYISLGFSSFPELLLTNNIPNPTGPSTACPHLLWYSSLWSFHTSCLGTLTAFIASSRLRKRPCFWFWLVTAATFFCCFLLLAGFLGSTVGGGTCSLFCRFMIFSKPRS